MDSQLEAPQTISTVEAKPLGWFESLLKTGAIFVSAVTAVGFPVVAVQFSRMGIPLDFITKDAMFRAGLLPVCIFMVITFLAWLYNPVSDDKRSSLRVAVSDAVRRRRILLLIFVLLPAIYAVLSFGIWLWRTVVGLVRYYQLFALPYSFGKVGVLLNILSFIFILVLCSRIVYWVARGRVDLRYLLAGRSHLWLDHIIVYFTMVISYSVLYPLTPYWAGGGQPREITMWVEQKSLPVSEQGFCHADGDLLRCNHVFLVYENSEIIVVSDGDFTNSKAIVLRRDLVKALTRHSMFG